jgi:hypothetical protein
MLSTSYQSLTNYVQGKSCFQSQEKDYPHNPFLKVYASEDFIIIYNIPYF